MSDPPPPTWNVLVSHINAPAILNGVLIGLLRLKGAIFDGEADQLFDVADSQLPERAGIDGANLLATVRIVADQVKAV